MKKISYGSQFIDNFDVEAVSQVLNSDFLTQGPKVPEFEQAISSYVGSKHCVAVNSATSALHIACLSLGITKNDIVWTVTNSFVASANCARYCGAVVDFLDIDLHTYNLSIEKFENKLRSAKIINQLPKVVIIVHFSGMSCDMRSILQLSKEYEFRIVEDASHAIGAEYGTDKVGSCKYSDITVFSFHPVKIITTGEGGCATTNNLELYKRMVLLRTHGVTRTNKNENVLLNPWEYRQENLGFNYRMTDIQAALGISQLQKLDRFIQQRNKLATRYHLLLDNTDFQLPQFDNNALSSWHLYVINLPERLWAQKIKIYNYLHSVGVGVNVHYQPIHTQPYYASLGEYYDLDNAKKYYSAALTLPLHPKISERDQNFIIQKLNEITH